MVMDITMVDMGITMEVMGAVILILVFTLAPGFMITVLTAMVILSTIHLVMFTRQPW